MLIWIPFAAITLTLAYLGDPQKNTLRTSTLFQGLLVVWLSWFVSFGSGAMQDHWGYVIYYNSMADRDILGLSQMLSGHISALLGSRTELEIGYTFLNILFNKMGFNAVGFLFSFALAANFLLIKFLYRYKYPVFMVLILICLGSYTQQANLVRQMMAVSIFLYSTKYIVQKNIQYYILSIFIGSLIHVSLLFLLPLYYLLNLKPHKSIMLGILLLSLLIGLIDYTLPLFDYSFLFYGEVLKKVGVGVSYQISWLTNISLFIVILGKDTEWDNEPKNNIAFNMFFIGEVLRNLVIITPWFFRLSLYFTITASIMLPMVPFYINHFRISGNSTIRNYVAFIAGNLLKLYFILVLIQITISDGRKLGTIMYKLSEIFKE
jgi:hypothetical protein